MTEIQAVIGRIQLQRMPQWHEQRLVNCEAIWRTARELGSTSLMFLCHPTLTNEEIRKTCSVVREVMAEAALEL